MTYRVGVDIGGTFTDFCAFNEATRELHTLKVLSRPDAPGSEVMEGVRQLETRFGIPPASITYFTHGTTVGVNTVIQRKGIKLALLTTENFSDVLELARLKMPDPYSLTSKRPDPLIPREMVFGVGGRMRGDGVEDEPVDEKTVRDAVKRAKAAGAKGIVIALINSYRNAVHEHRVREIVRKAAPELPVFCSADVWSIIREYERTVTAVIHGYVQPRVAHYLTSLQDALKGAGVPAVPFVTKSNGGVMSAELGKTHCAQMIMSGTAAGVIGAAYVARLSGFANTMSLDIGGTSADVAFIRDGLPQYGTGEMIGEFPIYIPTVAVTSIGAGGGSIAWLDDLGVLQVGPESAGSTPGPACYGRGGTRPTITDAFVAMGFMGHEELGYSAVTVDRASARAAIATVSKPLGMTEEEAAEAIVKIAVSGMYMECSKLVSHYGVDPREYALQAFGGAGPMMACFVAREMGMTNVVIPTTPGVLSALGGLIADIKNDFIKTVYLDVTPEAALSIKSGFTDLRALGETWLREEQKHRGASTLLYSADMRYRGQSYEIEASFDGKAVERGDVAALMEAFHVAHARIYGHADRDAAVQIINLRLVIVGGSPKPELPRRGETPGRPKPALTIEVHLDGKRETIPLYRRADMAPGATFDGPCVIAQADCTTCVPHAFTGKVDAYGHLILTLVR